MRRDGDIPLSILGVDAGEATARIPEDESTRDQEADRITIAHCAEKAQRELRSSLKRIRRMARTADGEVGSTITPELSAELDRAILLLTNGDLAPADRRAVFLSHRLAETEYVEGLTRLLKQAGFTILTGNSANASASQAILQRISASDYFVCLMTRDKQKADGNYTTNPWLLEEKGAALALKKPVVLLIEHGVDEFGGLQGDWQRIHFGPKGYLSAALQAVSQLNSYAGS